MDALTNNIARIFDGAMGLDRIERERALREKQEALLTKEIHDSALDLAAEAVNLARYPSIGRDSLATLKAQLATIEAALDILDPVEPLPETGEYENAHERAHEAEQREIRRG